MAGKKSTIDHNRVPAVESCRGNQRDFEIWPLMEGASFELCNPSNFVSPLFTLTRKGLSIGVAKCYL